jgi:hypothetical protein
MLPVGILLRWFANNALQNKRIQVSNHARIEDASLSEEQ